MKLFSTIYNCHEQSTDSTRLALPGRDWPCLDHWHWHRHRHRWRCVYLNAPRGEFCAQQIYVYELYDMYAAAPHSTALLYASYCFKPPTNFTCSDLARESFFFAASLSPAAWLGIASTWFWLVFWFMRCTRSHLQLRLCRWFAPTTLVFAKQLAVSRLGCFYGHLIWDRQSRAARTWAASNSVICIAYKSLANRWEKMAASSFIPLHFY